MFGLFKKDKTTMTAIDKVLDEFKLGGQPLMQMISKKEQNKDTLNIDLTLPNGVSQQELETIYQALQTKLYSIGIVETNLNVAMTDHVTSKVDTQMHTPPSQAEPTIAKAAPQQKDLAMHPRIRHILVVASGKGGVGKSTTAVNIALALQKLGEKVGILDADIYGPSVPDMLGVAGVHPAIEHDKFIPIDVGGLAMLSIGSLLDGDSTPVAWRGIKATGALMQLYNQTNWPNLDYLVIDMPPGTGDIQLTLAQRIPVTAAVIVTTPQHIALLDAKKGIELFAKTHIPVLGIVENMALHTCSNCGHTETIFGSGGAEQITQSYGVPLIGQLPLASGIREQMDKGVPSVMANDEYASYYVNIAQAIQAQIGQFTKVRTDGRIF